MGGIVKKGGGGKQRAPSLKIPLNWTGSVFPLLSSVAGMKALMVGGP